MLMLAYKCFDSQSSPMLNGDNGNSPHRRLVKPKGDDECRDGAWSWPINKPESCGQWAVPHQHPFPRFGPY